MLCPLCGKRNARRACPALGHLICAVCCGTKRLTEIACPSDCGYLATARSLVAPGGIFIFDFWYGPAVLADPPAVRIKRLENERMKVLYGPDYRMWIDSKPGEGTRTGIEIPYVQVATDIIQEIPAAG